MVTSIRFDEAENILITAAATRAGTSKHEFMREAILQAAAPGTISTPATPPKPSLNAKPAPVTTPPRSSKGVNMANLADFYGR